MKLDRKTYIRSGLLLTDAIVALDKAWEQYGKVNLAVTNVDEVLEFKDHLDAAKSIIENRMVQVREALGETVA